ncbi:MAG: fused MFS/spermidine synthase, partial [Planctomycetes bacterium]|nr:fused MFS/spermidine synthase [Planctomycetota bacterium]
LPIVVERVGLPVAGGSPALWLLGCLSMTVGLPFFVVSTSGPLLQKWFAGTNHPSAKDPFFLYAASNVGSLIALLAYPLLLERWLPVNGQSRLWSYGYALLIALVGACAVLLWCRRHRATEPELLVRGDIESTEPVPTRRRRMLWIFAAFVPSSLMLGVTTHITSNLAPVPLLWVLPLSIYLLTFALVFARKQLIPSALTTKLLPFMVLPLAIITVIELPKMGWVSILAHLTTFFVAAMVCHGQLARSRPHVRHLTEYYLWISIGGVLGGIFNALISPVVFSSIAEYPIALVLACFLLPRGRSVESDTDAKRNDLTAPLVVAGVTIAAIVAVRLGGWGDSLGMRLLLFGPLALVCFSFKDRPVRFTLGFAVFVVALPYYCAMHRGTDLHASRNFFGVKRVTIDTDDRIRILVHGTTTHGKQFIDPARRDEPLTYYHRTGPLGDIFATFDGDAAKTRVAAIGLGAGSLAAYIGPGQSVTFYEIDPEIERIARNPDYFTFLTDCRGDMKVVVGDGRLTLAQAPDRHYGLIVLDAFSSDAIPTHLLTREAIELYLSKLEDDGVLAFHISNRYLNLEPLIAGLGADAGLVGLTRTDTNLTALEEADGKTPSIYAVLARKREHLGDLADHPDWTPLSDPSGVKVWTDQYTSILSFFTFK